MIDYIPYGPTSSRFVFLADVEVEHLIQLVASLPTNSSLQTSLTDSLLGNLWNVLRHPPLSYLGDKFKFRMADGSNNVSLLRDGNARISCTLNLVPPALHMQRVSCLSIRNSLLHPIQELFLMVSPAVIVDVSIACSKSV
jgi:hypothetical protein